MRATVTRDALYRALRAVVPFADPANNMPILANVRLVVRSGTLEIAATDTIATARAELPVTDTSDGAATCPARKVAEIVKSFPAGARVRVTATAERVTINASWARASGTPGRCEFRLMPLHASLFPKIPAADGATWSKVHPARVAALLAESLRSASTDESRPHLCAVRLESDGITMRATATDGHRLTRPAAETGGTAFAPVVVRREGIARMVAALDGASSVELAVGEGHLHARVDGAIVVSAQYSAGEFPDVRYIRADVRAMRSSVRLDVDTLRAELRALIRSACVPRRDAAVTLGWAHGTLRLTVEAATGAVFRRDLAARCEGPAGVVCLDAAYLRDALRGEGDVAIGIQSKGDPVAVLCPGAEFPTILMPRKDGCSSECVPAPALAAGEAEASSAASALPEAETPSLSEAAKSPIATDEVDPLAIVLGEVPGPVRALEPAPAPLVAPAPVKLAPIVPIERARAKREAAALAKRPVVAIDVPAGEVWTACDKPARVTRAGHPFDEDGARVAYYTNRDATLDYVCVRKGGHECWYTVHLAAKYRRGR